MNRKKIEKGIRLVLEGIGEDLEREGLKDTPQRFARMCEEIFSGMETEALPTRSFNEPLGNSSLITIRDISFYSMCEHHLLPFFGKVEIVYAPENNRIAGFSDFARIVNVYSRRLQIQERMTEQIADAIVRLLQPKGVRVTVEALQLCAAMRGEHRNNVQTVTRCVRGSFHEDA